MSTRSREAAQCQLSSDVGLVRPKNALSVLTHVFYTVCIVTLIWVIYGYSLAFTGGSTIIGGLDKLFLKGVTADSQAATFSVGVPISEYVYVCFQMTFACITPALIVGAFAERMKFSAVALFIPLWVTLIYFPIAHMVWYWAGPDAISDAVKALAAAGSDAAAKDKVSRFPERIICLSKRSLMASAKQENRTRFFYRL